ncbi:hypothetical protein HYU13_03345 [Candidatus Woesearchaeota archaeon]|nr:hypothetical protein [Candidatus Woesearchaeota archaeon]
MPDTSEVHYTMPFDDEEDDMSLDFGKVKDFFKKKKEGRGEPKKEEARAAPHQPKGYTSKKGQDEDEISIDFSKVKGFFRKLTQPEEGKLHTPAHQKDEEKGEEMPEVDITKMFSSFARHKKIFLAFALLLIPLLLSLYLRLQPAVLPITDTIAQDAVYQNIKAGILGQISQQYPNLPEPNKNALVEAEFQKLRKQKSQDINSQIAATSAYFRSTMQDSSGQTYLLGIDPYYWMRHAGNIIKNGHPGDELKKDAEGREAPYDNFMYAPKGRFVPFDMFHAYSIASVYKLMKAMKPSISLMTAAFFTPVIFSLLSLLPLFFLGRRVAGNVGGFLAAIIFSLHPALLARTSGGFADNDIYNVFFPLMVIWLFTESLFAVSKVKKAAYALASGLFVGLFSFSWSGGWWLVVLYVAAASTAFLIFVASSPVKKDALGGLFTAFIVFIFSAVLFTSFFSGFQAVNDIITGPGSFLKLKEVAVSSVWPNVFTTVAEQNPTSLKQAIDAVAVRKPYLIIALLGLMALLSSRIEDKKHRSIALLGSAIFLMAVIPLNLASPFLFLPLMGLPFIVTLLYLLKKREQSPNIFFAMLMLIWLSAVLFASIKGVRYALLAAPPFALCLSLALKEIYERGVEGLTGSLKLNGAIAKGIGAIVVLMVVFPIFSAAKSQSFQQVPLINDAWQKSLEGIDKAAAKEAIINSWWDFGHWFKALANRPVTFDGTSQNSPNAHWVGSALLAEDEGYAAGVLRMLDCGQNDAFDSLSGEVKDPPEAIALLRVIVKEDKGKAEKMLREKNISEAAIGRVLSFTHCSPPENYFIASEDMVGKAPVWSHFALWDFQKALVYKTLKQDGYQKDKEKSITFLQSYLGIAEADAEDLYFEVLAIKNSRDANDWIAPWPQYQGRVNCRNAGTTKVQCSLDRGIAITIDTATLETDGIETSQGRRYPKLIAMPRADGTIVKKEFNQSLPMGMLLVPSKEQEFIAVISDPELTLSFFSRLFYLEGHGLKFVEKISEEQSIFGSRIQVWKINWLGNATNMHPIWRNVTEQKKEDMADEEIAPIISPPGSSSAPADGSSPSSGNISQE